MTWGLSGAEIITVLCSISVLALLVKVISLGHQFSRPKVCFPLNGKDSVTCSLSSRTSESVRGTHWQEGATEEIAADRTLALQHALNVAESLRHLTANLLQCLDETEVLYAALQELAVVLDVVCGNTVLYRHFCPVTRSYLAVEPQQYAQSQSNGGQHSAAIELDVVSEYMSGALDINGLVISQPQCFEDLFQRANGLSYQVCIQIKALQSCWYTVFFCPITDDRGSLLGDIILLRDCGSVFKDAEVHFVQQVATQCAIAIRQSQLYQAAQTQVEELERLNQLKDDFLSTISHELRTPMSNIQMGIDALERHLHHPLTFEREGGEPILAVDQWTVIMQCIQMLKDESQRESELIEDLLNLSRLEAGTEPFLPTEMALRSWLSHISEVFLTQTRRRNQRLVINVAHSLRPLTTDFTLLERIITELLQNACKYTPPGGSITISAYLQTGKPDRVSAVRPHMCHQNPGLGDGAQVANPLQDYQQGASECNEDIPMMVIQVSNTGIEIPYEECDRIFDKFYRIPSNDPWKHGGTGLGLALVKRLVEHLRGTIHAFSANQQVHMLLRLPLLPPHELRNTAYMTSARNTHS